MKLSKSILSSTDNRLLLTPGKSEGSLIPCRGQGVCVWIKHPMALEDSRGKLAGNTKSYFMREVSSRTSGHRRDMNPVVIQPMPLPSDLETGKWALSALDFLCGAFLEHLGI